LLTQTLKFKFLYVTDSTLKPIVGIVVTTSPICVHIYQHISSPSLGRKQTFSLYNSVVLPALSWRSTMISQLPFKGKKTEYQPQDQYSDLLLRKQ
jgi:hypothetical protein